MSQEKKPLNIYQRINEVRKKAHYLQKDKEVQGYKAVTHDAVTALTRNHLIDYGVVVVPRLTSSSVTDIGQTKSGMPIIRYAGMYEIDFINVDDPDDRITVTAEAHANDHGDKAPGKATSYATKYAMLKLFSIETGENEEGRVEAYGVVAEPLSEDQSEEINELLQKTEADESRFLRYLERVGKCQIETVEAIPSKMYKDAKVALEAKLKKRGKDGNLQ